MRIPDKRRIQLGYPLDQLLDPIHCKLPPEMDPGGICFSDQDATGHPGSLVSTGNIVLRGRPGTGKSTLALQIAVACAESGHLAVYLPLETSVEKVAAKAQQLGWGKWLRQVRHLHTVEEPSSREKLAQLLGRILTQPPSCPAQKGGRNDVRSAPGSMNCVLVPALSPRSISPEDMPTDSLFWERYRQVNNLLQAAACLSENTINIEHSCIEDWEKRQSEKTDEKNRKVKDKPPPKLRVVCIDSLSVFGDRPLTREQLFRLFDLFTQHKVTGVFVVEEDVASSSDSATLLHDETVDYLADVVISLEASEDKGHAVSYLEITKSRYQRQTLGKHPFKIRARDPNAKSSSAECTDRDNQLFQVFPSVHYLVSTFTGKAEASSPQGSFDKGSSDKGSFDIGCTSLEGTILPPNLKRNGVLAIQGPRGTFKTTIAINFLMKGLLSGENGLLIRFHDNRHTRIPARVAEEIANSDHWPSGKLMASPTGLVRRELGQEDSDGSRPGKVLKTEWSLPGTSEPKLLELDFNTGYLLPEEFMDEILHTFLRAEMAKKPRKPITRVVLDDVATIGLSYPLLYSSRTAGDMFLSAFVHFMRMRGVSLVMTGTTGQLAAANECVSRACAASDAILTCDFCDVFGDRHVILAGEGLLAGARSVGGSSKEQVPGILTIQEPEKTFNVDLEHLHGLVGFDTGHIRRPGLSLHLFEGVGVVHQRYNKDVERMLRFAFASPDSVSPMEQDVSLVTFNSRTSASMFDSLDVLRERPLNRTIVCSLDEFCVYTDNGEDKLLVELDTIGKGDDYLVWLPKDKPACAWPYYANVLLLAYRNDILNGGDIPAKDDKGEKAAKLWSDVLALADIIKGRLPGFEPKVDHAFEYDLTATETRACMVLDTAFALQRAQLPQGEDRDVRFSLKRKRAEEDGTIHIDLRTEECRGELQSLQKLLYMAPSRPVEDRERLDSPSALRHIRGLSETSAIYVCWYSQLRELIYNHPELAEKISVCGLPGGGFRGDWYLGVTKGSLSTALGTDVIKTLCRPTEDYKRFARGVGLPALKTFRHTKGLPAWPNAIPGNTLRGVLEIHREAWCRSDIVHYRKVRRTLYTAAQELARARPGAAVDDIINRMLLAIRKIAKLA